MGMATQMSSSGRHRPQMGHTGDGAAIVYLGSPGGPHAVPDWTGYGLEDASYFRDKSVQVPAM